MRRLSRIVAQSMLAVSFGAGFTGFNLALGQGQSPPPVRAPRPQAPAAQPATAPDSPKPARTPPNPGRADPKDLRVEFSNQVLAIPSVGLSVPVPADCDGSRMIEPSTSGQAPQVALQILPGNMSEAWSVQIRAPHVANAKLTPDQCADEALKLFNSKLASAANQGLGSKATVKLQLLDRVPSEQDPRKHLFGGNDRQLEFVRWYAEVQSGDGLLNVVRGLVVAKVGDTQFLTYELTTTKREFESARRMLEAIVAASTLKKPEDIGADRFGAVRAGANLKKSVTEADLNEIIAAKPERWFRFFNPSASGRKSDDAEVGYIRYQFKAGQRGEVDRNKSKGAWGTTEREAGWLIFSDIRMISGPQVIDSQAGYFLRKDREGEFWSVETAIRDHKNARTAPIVIREMGVREGLSMQVETTNAQGQTDSITPMMQGSDQYLSRVEFMLAPQMMIRAKAQAEYSYYTWIGDNVGRIRLCRNILERPAENPTQWKLTTRYGDEGATQTSYYQDNGDLIRTELPKGIVIEPSTHEELMKLWSDKGLPVGSIK